MKKILFTLLCSLLAAGASARAVKVYCFFADDGRHYYEDENLKAVITVEGETPCLALYNKSGRTLYIDRTASSVTRNGIRSDLGATATQHGRKEAHAAGASDIRIAIAPGAVCILDGWSVESDIYRKIGNGKSIRPRKPGREWLFDTQNSPVRLQAEIVYATAPDSETPRRLELANHVDYIVMTGKKASINTIPAYEERYKNKSLLLFYDGTPTGWVVCGAVATPLAVAGLVVALTTL